MTPKNIRVAVCGSLPTACEHLLKQGVVQIDKYEDAAEIFEETVYDLILVYAPNAEGLLDIKYSRKVASGKEGTAVPVRLLNEPACHSALAELSSFIRRISQPSDCRSVKSASSAY